MNDVLPHSMRRNRRKFLGGRVDRRTPLFITLTHTRVYIVLGKGCPRVRAFPIRLLWKPACWSTISKRLILIGFLMEPRETI